MRLDVYKPKWPEDTHSRVRQELAALVAKLLFVFIKSWLSGEIPGGWRRGNITLILKKADKEKEKPRKLHAGKPHVCSWEYHGASPLGGYVKKM